MVAASSGNITPVKGRGRRGRGGRRKEGGGVRVIVRVRLLEFGWYRCIYD